MTDNNEVLYALSDNTISAIVRIIQFGLLSGTDVTDHFRRIRAVVGDDKMIEPSEEWLQSFEKEMIEMNDHVIKSASGATNLS